VELEGHTRAGSNRDGLWAGTVFVILFALFFAFRQESYWSDARHLIRALHEGSLRRHHFAYPPIAFGFHELSGLLGNDEPKLSLQLLSALSGALTGALLYLAGRRFGFAPLPSLFGVALVCASPVVSFYATCVEVHALQLAFAAGAVYWAACTRDEPPRSAAVAALFLTGIFGAHMAGLLWAPALLVFLYWKGSGTTRPRHFAAGLAIMILAAVGWRLANPGSDNQGSLHISRSLKELLMVFRPKVFYATLVQPLGVLGVVGILTLVSIRGSLRETLRKPHAAATLVLFSCMLPFAATLRIPERGAYYITLALPLGLMAAHLVQNGPRVLRVAAPFALLLQVYLGAKQYHDWEIDYPGAEWVPALREETGEKGVILAGERWEWTAIQFHSKLTCISPSMPQRPESAMPERGREVTLRMMERGLGRGGVLGVTRNFWESEDPLLVPWRELLLERYGEPIPGHRPEYLLFPRP